MHLRRAMPEDAPALLRVKAALPMPGGLKTTQGGFLLGTSLDQYGAFIERDLVWLLEVTEDVVGFAIVLGWETLRHSEIWQKRTAIKLEPTVSAFPERPAYFEQLAVLPKARAWAWYLAYHATCEALQAHDAVLTTTVRRPVTNTAVLPYLSAAGFTRVGQITERYPEVGEIVSDVHYLDKKVFLERTQTALFSSGLARAERQGWRLEPVMGV